MSDKTTIARPYAKAAFVVAVKDKALAAWSRLLKTAGEIIHDKRVQKLLQNPRLTSEQKYTWLADICASAMFTGGQNFLKLLANKKRLNVLEEIANLFEAYRIEQEKTLNVQITSAFSLSSVEEQQLTQALQARLQRKVLLQQQVDKNLLGGVIIQASDWVIDDSVRGKLQRLATALTN